MSYISKNGMKCVYLIDLLIIIMIKMYIINVIKSLDFNNLIMKSIVIFLKILLVKILLLFVHTLHKLHAYFISINCIS